MEANRSGQPGRRSEESVSQVLPDDRALALISDGSDPAPGSADPDALRDEYELAGAPLTAIPRVEPPTGDQAGRVPEGASPAPVPGNGRAEPALSIAGAAAGLGVATATLRSWERRYGLTPSLHTKGGHRRYGPTDLLRLRVMHRLTRAGVPAAEAARAALAAELGDESGRAGPFSALLWPDADRAEPSQLLPDVDPGSEGSSSVAELIAAGLVGGPPQEPGSGGIGDPGRVPEQAVGSYAQGLARAVLALDAEAMHGQLSGSLREHGVVVTWEELVRPVLGVISRRWAVSGGRGEVEHTFSAVLAAALMAPAIEVGPGRNDRPVLLAAVPEEMHDLPIVALRAALAEREVRALLMGARVPPEALADTVRRLGPPVVFLWAQLAGPEVPRLPRDRPLPTVILGGPGFGDPGADLLRPGGLATAVEQVLVALDL